MPVSPSRTFHVGSGQDGRGRRASLPHARDTHARINAIDETGLFGEVGTRDFRFTHKASAKDVRALYSTFSTILRLGDAERTALLDEIERIATEEFSGTVARPMGTIVYFAQRRPG